VQIEITDGITPVLSGIAHVSRQVALEQMSKSGNYVRKAARNRMRMPRNRHHWFQKLGSLGKRAPYKDLNNTKELGFRTKIDGTPASPESMSNMITSYLSEASRIMVVGGTHKRGTQVLRRDGQIMGKTTVYGVSKHTWSILNKLDRGARNEFHGWGPNGVNKLSMKGFRSANYVPHNFMLQGLADATPYIAQQLHSEYEKIIGKAVNRVNVQVKPKKELIK